MGWALYDSASFACCSSLKRYADPCRPLLFVGGGAKGSCDDYCDSSGGEGGPTGLSGVAGSSGSSIWLAGMSSVESSGSDSMSEI